MRINYKIIWVEDAPDDNEVKKEIIYGKIREHFMKPEGMDKPFTSYAEFKKEMLDKYTSNKFVDCDLLLIDYNLADNSVDRSQTGDELIKQLRDKGVYTDVLFYSDNMRGYKNSKNDLYLENVVYSDGNVDEFQIKFQRILDKQENLSMGIQNIRGYLMDATSDFDFISRNYVDKLYKDLGRPEKQHVLNKIKSFIEDQKIKEEDKFEKVSKEYDKDSLVEPSMSSLEYVMSVRNKIYVLAMILFYQNKFETNIKDVDEFATIFADNYQNEIVAHRNKLAHNKLKYGDNNYSHVKILKQIKDLSCVCDECNKDNYYTINDCANIRKNICETYKLFYKLYNELENGFDEK